MIITSLDNPQIKELKKLKVRKYRDLEGKFLVEGEHLVLEAHKKGLLLTLITEEDCHLLLDVETIHVAPKIMKELSSLTTPAIMIGVCKKIPNHDVLGNRIIMIDRIQDPGNLGAIIRSAVAFNVDTIILGEGTVDLYNPKVLRATQGLLFNINIIETNLNQIIPNLKQENYKVIGTSLIDGIDLNRYQTPHKWALIMGNEGNGIDSSIQKLCDDFIHINMNDACESLNVAIACSIILYQLDER